MKLSLDILEAEREAAQRIEEFGFTGLPICPISIAKAVGITVMAKDSNKPGVSGFLMLRGNDFGICHATHIKNNGFIRFTVAHELGHYFLEGHCAKLFPNGDGTHESQSGYVSHDQFERQADAFASALLMPEKYFVEAVRDAGEGFRAIEFLSDLCQTSITSTAIRYARFVEDPVAVIVSDGQYIDYCFTSTPIEDHPKIKRIAKGTILPPESRTAKFNRLKSKVSSGGTDAGWSSLDDWFDGAPQVQMKEDVVGLGSYGKTLTVLFTADVLDEEEEPEED